MTVVRAGQWWSGYGRGARSGFRPSFVRCPNVLSSARLDRPSTALQIAVSESGHHQIVNTKMSTVYVSVTWTCSHALIYGLFP